MNDWVVWCGLMWSGVTIHVPMCFIALLPQQITSNYYLLIKEWHLYVFTVAFNVVLSYGVIENRSPHSDQSDLRIEYSAVVWKIDNYTGYTIEKNRGSINWINNWILLFLEKKKKYNSSNASFCLLPYFSVNVKDKYFSQMQGDN